MFSIEAGHFDFDGTRVRPSTTLGKDEERELAAQVPAVPRQGFRCLVGGGKEEGPEDWPAMPTSTHEFELRASHRSGSASLSGSLGVEARIKLRTPQTTPRSPNHFSSRGASRCGRPFRKITKRRYGLRRSELS